MACHFYMDVEQEYEHLTDFLHSFPTNEEKSLSVKNRTLTTCDLSVCRVQPNHDRVATVLMDRLQRFLHEKHHNSVHNEEEVLFPKISLTDAEVIVLASTDHWTRSLPSSAPSTSEDHKKKKFSQHYVIRFNQLVFRDCRDVGVLVREFVLWLSHLSMQCDETHAALFFHAKPLFTSSYHKHQNATVASPPPLIEEGTDSSTTIVGPLIPLEVPRRCIIDTAVYSRNRMFRCYGSAKLKNAVLLFDTQFHQLEIESRFA